MFRITILVFLSFWIVGIVETHEIPEIWLKRIARHEIPPHHNIKKKLDRLFLAGRVIKDASTLKNAGFSAHEPTQYTKMILASHPKLKGYLIKLYRDDQLNAPRRPEYQDWVGRANGAALIREYLDAYDLWGLFKVPRKWIYIIPTDEFRPVGRNYKPRDTILVVEDMKILSSKENEKKWGSKVVTSDFLNAFYTLVLTLGLWDNAKPANSAFSIDGRVAFVDTQMHSTWPIAFKKLTPFLSSEMRELWIKLTKFNRKPK